MALSLDFCENLIILLGPVCGHHAGGCLGPARTPARRRAGERFGAENDLDHPALLDAGLSFQLDHPAVDNASQDLDHGCSFLLDFHYSSR
jgi:hypothetical protein